MTQVKIRLSSIVIAIQCAYRFSYDFFRDFLTDEDADCCITISLDNIVSNGRYHLVADGTWEGHIKTSSLLQKIADALVGFDVFLMHGAVVCVHNQAYLFTAPSGTGKTTHIDKWLKNCADSFVVNGDKPFIKLTSIGQQPLACGSPWAGKERQYTNTMIPLKSIIIMQRAEDNHIEQISFAQAFPFLLQQIHHPDDANKMRKTLHLIQRLNPAVTFWRFQCNNFKDDCFEVAYNALVGKQ